MKTRLIPFLLLPLLLVAMPTQAQVYKWKDAQGRTIISDSPPPGPRQTARPVGRVPAAPADAAAANQPRSLAEQEEEFRQRRQEANAKAEKERLAAAERQKKCNHAQRNQTMLRSRRSLQESTTNTEHPWQSIDAERRKQLREMTQREIQQNCR
ncbi:MAG: DUF4124 domain-containing protein [Zoogloeaceae bacterium]|jgi:DNA anti-recombination protein RmuC|nr:DUF4124 domain-containing protein [Zoogloeaceae bacterium]